MANGQWLKAKNFMGFINFFKTSAPKPLRTDLDEAGQRKLHRSFAFQSFVAGTLGYSLYYVCRTAISVMKGPILDSDFMSLDQLTTITSISLITYSIGKFVNGFLADHSNIKRFMATGLVISAIACLMMGVIGLTNGKSVEDKATEQTEVVVAAATVENSDAAATVTEENNEPVVATNVVPANQEEVGSEATTVDEKSAVVETEKSEENEKSKGKDAPFMIFLAFAILLGVSGWGQSMGAPPAIIALSRWFPLSKRGTYYGFFSASHNIGEGLSLVFVGSIVGVAGWQWGFIGAAIAGALGILIILLMMHDTPESKGLPSIEILTGEMAAKKVEKKDGSAGKAQIIALKSPAVWILALASGFMYISRYGMNYSGVLFMEKVKGFGVAESAIILSINAWAGVIGTVVAGWMSDVLFKGDRKLPALVSGILLSISYALFIYGGNEYWVTIVSMVLFGIAIGVLIAFLGGLMAVDLVPRKATGAALGIVGMVSYACASLGEKISGWLVNISEQTVEKINEAGQVVTETVEVYDFSAASIFWVGSSVISFLLPLLLWRKKKVNNEE
jgi:OPA family sugar phosphate sensor protein UhpC-like MFS transporter